MAVTTALGLRRTDVVVLRIVQVVAWIGAAITAVTAALTAAMQATSGVGAAPLGVAAGLPAVEGGVTVAEEQWLWGTLLVDGQPPLLAAMMIGALLVRSAGTVLVLLGIALLAGRMLRGRPLARAAVMPLGLVLIGVAGASTVADALEGWVSMATWEAMGTPSDFGAVSTFSPMPIYLGLVVAALMITFRIAGRMQRETEGLV
jgi:hypothetical protein